MTPHDKQRLAIVLARRCEASPDQVIKTVRVIARCATTLQRLNEKGCNGPDLTAHDERREKQAVLCITDELEALGVAISAVVRNHDPRGFPIFVVFKGEDIRSYSNDIGQRGYGIG